MSKLFESKADPDRVEVLREDEAILWIRMIDEAENNAFSPSLVGALLTALDNADHDRDLKAIVLSGTPSYFSTGATQEVLRELAERRYSPVELILGRRLLRLSVPVIVAAEGSAIGGGFALLIAADLAVIAEKARYGFNFMSLGITPGMGTTGLAEDYFPRPLAHELLFTGDFRRGESFRGVGSFNAILPADQVLEKAFQMAYAIAEKPRENIVLLKRTLTLPRRRVFEEAVTLESLMHESSLSHMVREARGET